MCGSLIPLWYFFYNRHYLKQNEKTKEVLSVGLEMLESIAISREIVN